MWTKNNAYMQTTYTLFLLKICPLF